MYITPPITETPFSQLASRQWPLRFASRWAGMSLTLVYAPQDVVVFSLASAMVFKELVRHGVTDKIPRLIRIQSEAVSPIYQAFSRKAGEVAEVPSRTTLAEGIACVHPVRGKRIPEIAQGTRGCFEIVSEKEIIEGWKELARRGIYVESTSAVGVRAIDRLQQEALIIHSAMNNCASPDKLFT